MLEMAFQRPCPTLKRRLKPVRQMPVRQLAWVGTLGPFFKKFFFGKARTTSQKGCASWVRPEMKINHSNYWQPCIETVYGCTHQRAYSLGSESRYFESLAGRPVLMTSSRRTAASSAVSLNFARLATAARRISLFFAEMPASRQRFLSTAICAYSSSGMVKLSRTSLAFFGFGGLAVFVLLDDERCRLMDDFLCRSRFHGHGSCCGLLRRGRDGLGSSRRPFSGGLRGHWRSRFDWPWPRGWLGCGRYGTDRCARSGGWSRWFSRGGLVGVINHDQSFIRYKQNKQYM